MTTDLSEKIEANRFLMGLRRFFMSKLCVVLQLVIAILIIILRNNGKLFSLYVYNMPMNTKRKISGMTRLSRLTMHLRTQFLLTAYAYIKLRISDFMRLRFAEQRRLYDN